MCIRDSSYLVLRGCVVPDGSTFRELAHKRYGDEEHLADIFVLYMEENGQIMTDERIFQLEIEAG